MLHLSLDTNIVYMDSASLGWNQHDEEALAVSTVWFCYLHCGVRADTSTIL